ncbi:mitochondrial inner membrane m-AAA protease component paraplegin-like isoform X2 [Lycorma delicatula]|uniref:mitochondrial inner membrane m-AAA protease component paraplegin-like isoform X2 n=1 Tax=Lycorma delicatula TaxID=130591 RepID=UPI003F5113C7
MMLDAYRYLGNFVHLNLHKIVHRTNVDLIRYYSLQYTNVSKPLLDSFVIKDLFNFFTKNESDIIKRCIQCVSRMQCKSECRSRSTIALLRKEQRALLNILDRSNFKNVRSLHTSAANFQQKNENDKNKKKKEDDEDNTLPALLAKAFFWMLTAYMLVASISLMFPGTNQPEFIRFVSWNEFVHHMLAKGEVEEIIVRPDLDIVTIILFEGAIIKGRRVDNRAFHMNIVDTNSFEEKLREAEKRLGIKPGGGVTVIYDRGSDAAGKVFVSLIIAGILLAFLSKARTVKPPISIDSFTQLGRAKFTLVDPLAGQGKGVHFSDVAGLTEAKQEVMEFVDYLKRPERYKNLGAKVPKGALLLGPPGCGKTLLAKAVATESNVPFLSMNGSEFIEMIGGLGAARVRDLFKEGRKRSPCIIYIDEIDAIGRKRSSGIGQMDGAMGEGEQTLNQLLVEMDGMASTEGVLMLASTNRGDVLDKALLRPGRFDRHIMIDLPVMDERGKIFEQHLKGIALQESPDRYSKRLAYLTPGFSGADIANVCNEAALHAARNKQRVVTKSDLEYAVERVVGGTEKRSHSMSPAEKRVVAYHESGHALVGWLLEHADALLKVTIVPRTNLALGFAQYTPRDQKLYSKEELFDKMCMALGGRAAEALMFNKVTTGAQNDLEKVTKIARAQVRQFGMCEEVGLLSFTEDKDSIRPYSKRLAGLMEAEEQKLVAAAYQRTYNVLEENQSKLEVLAEGLLKRETLNYDDVEKLVGPPPHDNKRYVESIDLDTDILHESEPKEKSTHNDDRKKSHKT